MLAASLLALSCSAPAPGPAGGGPAPAGGVRIRFDAEPESTGFGTVEVLGLAPETLARLRWEEPSPDGWAALFPVWTGEAPPAAGETRPTVLGSWRVEVDRVRFTPRFPFVPGQPYVARWRFPLPGREDRSAVAEVRFALPKPERQPSTVVTAVYPSADEVPENLLRIYLHFSAPMSRGGGLEHVRLLTAAGRELASPFVVTGPELWNPERTRLTLFFDPGRIKRGVAPNLEQGPPLTRGESYRLVVDAGWEDARGVALAEGFEKRFRVVAADRSSPRPEAWRLVPPAGPGEPVILDLREPLDHALLMRLPAVVEGGGEPVAGEVEVGEGERRWVFRPMEPWRPGRYEIRVPMSLEDPSGNSLHRPFETALEAVPDPGSEPEPVRIPFRIR